MCEASTSRGYGGEPQDRKLVFWENLCHGEEKRSFYFLCQRDMGEAAEGVDEAVAGSIDGRFVH